MVYIFFSLTNFTGIYSGYTREAFLHLTLKYFRLNYFFKYINDVAGKRSDNPKFCNIVETTKKKITATKNVFNRYHLYRERASR